MKLVYTALSALGRAHGATQHDGRTSIGALVKAKYGDSKFAELQDHGCWAANLDIANRAWTGGSNRVDDIDELFALWFSAYNCMDEPGAECNANATNDRCTRKINEINAEYMKNLDTLMSAFSKRVATSCPKQPPRADRDTAKHCAGLVPNYVAPVCVGGSDEAMLPTSALKDFRFGPSTASYSGLPASYANDGKTTDKGSGWGDFAHSSTVGQYLQASIDSNNAFDEVRVWTRGSSFERYQDMKVIFESNADESETECAAAQKYDFETAKAIYNAGNSLVFNCPKKLSNGRLFVKNDKQHIQVAEVQAVLSAEPQVCTLPAETCTEGSDEAMLPTSALKDFRFGPSTASYGGLPASYANDGKTTDKGSGWGDFAHSSTVGQYLQASIDANNAFDEVRIWTRGSSFERYQDMKIIFESNADESETECAAAQKYDFATVKAIYNAGNSLVFNCPKKLSNGRLFVKNDKQHINVAEVQAVLSAQPVVCTLVTAAPATEAPAATEAPTTTKAPIAKDAFYISEHGVQLDGYSEAMSSWLTSDHGKSLLKEFLAEYDYEFPIKGWAGNWCVVCTADGYSLQVSDMFMSLGQKDNAGGDYTCVPTTGWSTARFCTADKTTDKRDSQGRCQVDLVNNMQIIGPSHNTWTAFPHVGERCKAGSGYRTIGLWVKNSYVFPAPVEIEEAIEVTEAPVKVVDPTVAPVEIIDETKAPVVDKTQTICIRLHQGSHKWANSGEKVGFKILRAGKELCRIDFKKADKKINGCCDKTVIPSNTDKIQAKAIIGSAYANGGNGWQASMQVNWVEKDGTAHYYSCKANKSKKYTWWLDANDFDSSLNTCTDGMCNKKWSKNKWGDLTCDRKDSKRLY
jgi:hypothetical protein